MINLQQLYNVGIADRIDIFEGLVIPSECTHLNADVLRSACFERCGLNIPIYPDPDTMRAAITLWAKKNSYTFIHVDKIIAANYSPIENVFEDTETERKFDGTTDRKDDSTVELENASEKHITDTLTNDITSLAHGKKVTESGSDDNNTTNSISAYDSAGFQNDNKSENKITYGHTATDSGTDTTTRNYVKKEDITNGGGNTTTTDASGKETKDDLEKIKTSRHGNIGITSTNKLQIEEYKMLMEYNPYDFLAELFEHELTLYIY